MTIRARIQLVRSGFKLDAEFEIPGKGVTALFGQSGSGKSTLLRCLAGLERSSSGVIFVGDACWQDDTGNVFLSPHQRSLGYVFQDARLFPHLDVRRNLEFGWKRVPPMQRRIEFDQVVQWLGLENIIQRMPPRLSGGEQQRVAIARALLTSPQLLIMDEPLAALDATAKAEILPYLERLPEQLSMPVIYVSHALEEVTRLADSMLLLKDGKLIASGNLKDVMTRLDLPLSHMDEAGSVIDATVIGHDDEFQLTCLKFSGGQISVSRLSLNQGSPVRVRILARDVSIALGRPEQTSILNVFAASVIELGAHSPSQLLVRLAVGTDQVVARITRKSAALLDLKSGCQVFAQVKSVALVS